MRATKRIVFLSDLEGTLINNDGTYDEENFYNFLTELSRLGKDVGARVEMSIASPLEANYMEEMLRKLDRSIFRHERLSNEENDISIVGATTFEQSYINNIYSIKDNRIMPIRTIGIDTGAQLKYTYVKGLLGKDTTIDGKLPNDDVLFYIYAGNGENDIGAMTLVNHLKNGLTISPKNSTKLATETAKINSDKEGILGITDCISMIREKIHTEILDKKQKDKEEVSKSDAEGPEI